MTVLDKNAYKLYVDFIIRFIIPITFSEFTERHEKYNIYNNFYDKALKIERQKKLKKLAL